MSTFLDSETFCPLQRRITDSVSGESNNGVTMNLHDSPDFSCSISEIDSTVEGKQEIVEIESDSVSESGDEKQEMIFSEIEEKQEIVGNESDFVSASGNEVQMKMIDPESFAGVEEMQKMIFPEEPESFLVFSVTKEEKDLSENEEESSSEVQDSGNNNNIQMDSDNKKLESISQTQNLVEVMGDLRSRENNLEILLDGKEKHYLVENELGSIPEAQTSGVKMVDFKNPGESTRNSSEIKEGFGILSQINEKHGMIEIEAQSAYGKQSSWDGYGNPTSEIKEMREMVKTDGQKMNVFMENEENVENSVQSEGKCETPVTHFHPVCVSRIGKDCGKNEIGFMALGKSSDKNEKNIIKQEMVLKKEKCSKRRGKGMKKVSEMSGKQNVIGLQNAKAQNASQNKGDGTKRSYSRTELQALRFMDGEKQGVTWKKIYLGLQPVVARQLDSMHQKQGCRNVDYRRNFGKKKEAGATHTLWNKSFDIWYDGCKREEGTACKSMHSEEWLKENCKSENVIFHKALNLNAQANDSLSDIYYLCKIPVNEKCLVLVNLDATSEEETFGILIIYCNCK
ncbi:hypothetical protein HHK36_013213 [Tetracentron sinense]|uniref:Uncharacterized protein n=1 Tax=Tetracentron sinense TaxID=13715 RepID=A0A834ZE76_TETSI|nr:hypothetical protein HHK36_013213 [Tetracentron sinense]